jgi:hypothetical protein
LKAQFFCCGVKILKIIFAVLFCLSASLGVFAQAEMQTPGEIGVETVSLARDDGAGKPGDVVEGFLTNDVPIHCLIELTSRKALTVKMNLVAVKAAGTKAGANVVTASYKTNGQQNRVRFYFSPDDVIWAAGTYRVDVLLDDKLAKSLEFEIVKTPQQIEKEKQKPSKPAPIRGKKLSKSRKA